MQVSNELSKVTKSIRIDLEAVDDKLRLLTESAPALAVLTEAEKSTVLLRSLVELEEHIAGWKQRAAKHAMKHGVSARKAAQIAQVSQDTSRQWKREAEAG